MHNGQQRRFDRRDEDLDSPMYSRLFIVCSKESSEDDFRSAFSPFGTIEEIRLPTDQNGQAKGVAFIKFSKTSEAAIALEAMNFKSLPSSRRALKVMVAANRSEVANSDVEKYRRLFVTVSRGVTESDLEDEFKNYGHITAIILQKDHFSGESKGFAYITYAKFSQAAVAMEECDKKYRAIFAKPKSQSRPETTFESRIDKLSRNTAPINDSQQYLISMMKPGPVNSSASVNFMCCPQFNIRQMERLFDIIPGFIKCNYFVDLAQNAGKGTAFFNNPKSAAYAVEKLNEFEYPPGMKLFVKIDNTSSHIAPAYYNPYNDIPQAFSKLKNAIQSSSNSSTPDLVQLAEAIAEASKLIKKATGTSDSNIPDSNDLNYCSVKLPSPQPLAHIDSAVAKRCFLVCKPSPPPLTVLRDVFCRFGGLISVYTLPNKTVGYASYSTEQAADEAISVLHGAEICGVRIKVLPADEESVQRKRQRTDY